jgi:hypothetical protein
LPHTYTIQDWSAVIGNCSIQRMRTAALSSLMRQFLAAPCRLLQEYKDQRFAADEEFEPEHIVAQRPPGQPREVRPVGVKP